MKKNIPNVLTCLNLVAGSVGVYYVLLDKEPKAIYFVLIGGAFDFLDGLVARLLKVSSEIGKQLDSLADLITFGLLPSFFILKMLEPKTEFFWIALLVVAFSAIRLAIFNTDNSQSDSFKGLPVPANAIMLTSLAYLPFDLSEATLISVVLLSSFLLVSNFRLIALKFKTFGWRGNEAKWVLIVGILLLAFVFQWTFLPFVVPFYIGVSLLSGLIKGTV